MRVLPSLTSIRTRCASISARGELGPSVQHRIGRQLVRRHDQDVAEVAIDRSAVDVCEGPSNEATGTGDGLRIGTESPDDIIHIVRRHVMWLPAPVGDTRRQLASRRDDCPSGSRPKRPRPARQGRAVRVEPSVSLRVGAGIQPIKVVTQGGQPYCSGDDW